MKRDKREHQFWSDLSRQLRPILVPRKRAWIDKRRNNKQCIFCGGSPTNFEHIWPAWSHKYLPRDIKSWYSVHAIKRRDRTDINLDKRRGDPLDRQVNAVDEKCNNGWMREKIEMPAEEVLTRLFTGNSNPTRITEDEQRLIASWIALRTMVAEYDHYAPHITHHMQRKRLWKTQRISETNWRVWIGNYEGRQAASLWIQHSFQLVPTNVATRRKTDAANYANGQTLTYVIGKLLIHIMYCPDPVALRIWNFPALVSGKFRRIWPPTGLSIQWPIPALTDMEANFASGAFQNFLLDSAARRAAHPRAAAALRIIGE